MQDHAANIRALLEEAGRLPRSSAQLAILEEAVRLADLHQDVALGIEAREPLMYVARNLLRGDILATAFVWCLAQYDREPQRFAGRNLLTEHRWVIDQLANIPDIARTTLDDMLTDFGRRLEAAGFSRRHVSFTQRAIAPDLGDRALAIAANRECRNHPPDGLSPGPLWELAEEVESELFVGQEDQALRLARPFLEDRSPDRNKSDQVCGYLLLPLLKRGQVAQAARLQTRCLRSYHPERCYYWWFGELIKFSALSNDINRSVRLYAECQRAIQPFTDPLTRLHFALDAIVLFDRLVAAGKQELPLRLPDFLPVSHHNGHYPVADLRDWLGHEASELAQRFDTRNGNSHFREQIQERAELQRWAIK